MFTKLSFQRVQRKKTVCLRCQFSVRISCLTVDFLPSDCGVWVKTVSLTGKPLELTGLHFFYQTLLYLLFYYDNGISMEILRNFPASKFSQYHWITFLFIKLFKIHQFFFEVRILATTVRVSVFQAMIYFKANVKKYNKLLFSIKSFCSFCFRLRWMPVYECLCQYRKDSFNFALGACLSNKPTEL